jgi:hypothetical protein
MEDVRTVLYIICLLMEPVSITCSYVTSAVVDFDLLGMCPGFQTLVDDLLHIKNMYTGEARITMSCLPFHLQDPLSTSILSVVFTSPQPFHIRHHTDLGQWDLIHRRRTGFVLVVHFNVCGRVVCAGSNSVWTRACAVAVSS